MKAHKLCVLLLGPQRPRPPDLPERSEFLCRIGTWDIYHTSDIYVATKGGPHYSLPLWALRTESEMLAFVSHSPRYAMWRTLRDWLGADQ